MSEASTTGPRKIPEAEKKFNLNLRAQLSIFPEIPVDVGIVFTDKSEATPETLQHIATTLDTDEVLHTLGGTMLGVTVHPPDVRQKLTQVAESDSVRVIILNEPMMPITIPRSLF